MQDGPGKKKESRISGSELPFRRFIAEQSLDGGVAGSIVEFYRMAIAISSQGFELGLKTVSRGLDTTQPAADVVADVAEHLTRKISGQKADILRKAIQETLLHASGLGYGPEPLDVKAGLEKFLRKRGPKKILELLLSSYVFNFIWVRMQDTVRSQLGSHALANSMLVIERFCVSVVKSVLREWENERKLDELAQKKRLGTTLIKTIQTRLVDHPNPPLGLII